MKRFLGLVIAVMLLVACFGSGLTSVALGDGSPSIPGGKVNAEGMPIMDEPTTFTLMAPRIPQQGDWQDMWIFDQIKQLTNIDIRVENVNSESWVEKKNLAFATDTLPDFFVESLAEFDLVNYGAQGQLIKLNDLIDQYAPITKGLFDTLPEYRKACVAPDGSIYGVPGFLDTPRERNARRWYVNTKWIENLNMEIPKTVDELYEVLVAFKTQDPNGNGEADEIPVGGMYIAQSTVASSADGLPNYFAMDVPVLSAYGYVHPRIDTVDDQVVFVPTESNYKEYLTFMNKLYAEGLLDAEYFSQTEEQFAAKGRMGQYGMVCYYADWALMPDEELYSQYASIEPLVSDFNNTQMWPAHDIQKRGVIAITSKCENPEALVRLMDWMFSYDGSIMVQMGVENGKWEGGVGGWELVTNDEGAEGYNLVYDTERYESFNDFRQKAITTMSMPYVSYSKTQPIVERMGTMDPRQKKLTADIVGSFFDHYRKNFPLTLMTQEESDELNILQTDLYSYVDQMDARFITGEESLDNFDAFVEGCKARGADQFVSIRQSVYDRWKNS